MPSTEIQLLGFHGHCRGQNLEAEADAEAIATRPRPRLISVG